MDSVTMAGLFQAGATLAGGIMANQDKGRDREQTAVENEKDRQKDLYVQQQNLALSREQLAGQLAMAQADEANKRKMALANLIQEQGKTEADALSRNMTLYGQTPERTNDAIATLVASLRGGR